MRRIMFENYGSVLPPAGNVRHDLNNVINQHPYMSRKVDLEQRLTYEPASVVIDNVVQVVCSRTCTTVSACRGVWLVIWDTI